MRRVAAVPTDAEARNLAAMLQSRGLSAVAGCDLPRDGRSRDGAAPVAGGGAQVFVPAAEVDRARQLLGDDLAGGACRR